MAKAVSWDLVSDSEFEKLAFFLLKEEDFYNLKWFGRGGGDKGRDKGRDLVGFTYEEPITGQRHEKKWVIQCKHYTKPLNKSVLKEDLAKAEQHNPDYWLLSTNLPLTSDDLACNVPELDKGGKKIGESLWNKIDKYINIWLDDPNKEYISLLGEFGAGKTWFCLHYTYKRSTTTKQ